MAGAGSEDIAKAKKEVAIYGVASELEPEWMILTWPRPMHFEHTAVDDHPGLSGSRTKLSVSLPCSLAPVSELTPTPVHPPALSSPCSSCSCIR